MRPISLAALTVLGLSPAEHILCAEKTGYDGVGLRLIPATQTEPSFPVLGDPASKSKLKKLVQDTGMKVFDIEVLRLEPSTNIKEHLSFIELGVELGAKNILVAGYDPVWSRMTENWLELCELTHLYGIKPHIEPMPWTFVKSFLDGVNLLKTTPKDLGAILIDPIHFFRTGGNLNQLSLGHISKAAYIQLSDAPIEVPNDMAEIIRQAREDRLPPGDGQLPLKSLLELFPPDLPVSLEVPLSVRWNCKNAEQKALLVLKHTREMLDSFKQAN